jgi:serine/threonine-protein kinase
VNLLGTAEKLTAIEIEPKRFEFENHHQYGCLTTCGGGLMLPESTDPRNAMKDQRASDIGGATPYPNPDQTVTHIRPESDPSSGAARIGRFATGTLLAGRYRLVSPLGSGGSGEVYQAEDIMLGHAVAVKFITRRIAHERDLLQRIVTEVRIGRQVSHPNLCRIYDIGEVDNQYFITMEYVDGENLASLLRRVGRYNEETGLHVAHEICAGLAAAHDRGVVHRDLKPSNVMIDGRGRARITDYGLAIVAGETTTEAFAGTPAYMAPEQLEGGEATEQSDIYALGLVLYEIFTGERLYSGTLSDISNAHRESKRPPSTIVRGLSPTIERVILHCIEERPSDRPESVRDVLAALPGGDALRAALAAGETPSPRAVATANRVGELSLPMAWTGAVTMALLMTAIVMVSRYTMLYRQAPLAMSPDVLTDRSRQIIAAAGYQPRPSGWRRWMESDAGVLQEATATTASLDRTAAYRQTSPLRFGYRESPRPLVPQGRGAIVTESDPPFNVPGMVTVMLDSTGRLVRFVRAPVPTTRSAAANVSWQEFFRYAGIDGARLQPAPATWVSPVDHDAKYAWSGVLPGAAPVEISVHAAALDGKPVFFEVGPRASVTGGARSSAALATATEEFTGVAGFAAVFLAGVVLAAIVARRNLRLGRGDRGAARKVSVLVFASLLVAGLLSADHARDPAGEWGLLVGIGGNALFHAGAIWLFYIAAEPYVRRRQPELLISWNRVLRGYFRDPLVGRDVLIGCLLGALINLFYAHLLVLVPSWLGMTPPAPDDSFPAKLSGGMWPLVSFAALLGSVPRDAVMALFLFSAARSLFRSQWIAAAAIVLLGATPHLGRDVASKLELPFVLCAAAIFVFALCRVGLLAGMVALFVGSWFAKSLFIFDARSWLFVPSLFYVSVTVLIAVYGFRYSVGAKPLFGRVRIAE